MNLLMFQEFCGITFFEEADVTFIFLNKFKLGPKSYIELIKKRIRISMVKCCEFSVLLYGVEEKSLEKNRILRILDIPKNT